MTTINSHLLRSYPDPRVLPVSLNPKIVKITPLYKASTPGYLHLFLHFKNLKKSPKKGRKIFRPPQQFYVLALVIENLTASNLKTTPRLSIILITKLKEQYRKSGRWQQRCTEQRLGWICEKLGTFVFCAFLLDTIVLFLVATYQFTLQIPSLNLPLFPSQFSPRKIHPSTAPKIINVLSAAASLIRLRLRLLLTLTTASSPLPLNPAAVVNPSSAPALAVDKCMLSNPVMAPVSMASRFGTQLNDQEEVRMRVTRSPDPLVWGWMERSRWSWRLGC